VIGLTLAWLALLQPAWAGSLDQIEVGGMWGTPGATNPTAVWWNPAGLAVGGGTQLLFEAVPTFGAIDHVRTNPDYGDIDPEFALDMDDDGEDDTTYDYGGKDRLATSGVVPFLGVSTDFGVDGLGVGAALFVPFATGGDSAYPRGSGHYHAKGGEIRAVYLSLATGYQIADVVALGASFSSVMSSWQADVDIEAYSSLGPAYSEATGVDIPDTYQDGYIEHPGYITNLKFEPLTDHTFTFGTGIYVTPNDAVGISLAYHHGLTVENTGKLKLAFSCPPLADFPSAAATGLTGLCANREPATIQGKSTVGYRLPSRLHGGVVLTAIDPLRLELMSGWVHWSQFVDYEIQTSIQADDVPIKAVEMRELAARMVSQNRRWARGTKNNVWVGVDGKVSPSQWFTFGGRVLVDTPAVPSSVVTVNNFDALSINLGALAVVKPVKMLDIGLSYRHQFLTKRTINDSAFALTLDEKSRKPDRFFWPEANGTYVGHINRIGISVRGHFFEGEPSKR
jgi:long-subunit fatty acid transport protein